MKDREQLLQRRDEILTQLEGVNNRMRASLDPDAEEQAIEIEQEEVPISMEDNLRRELAEIEDKLAELKED